MLVSRRDLKVKEPAASMARPVGAGKKKEAAGASEPRVPLPCLFPIESKASAAVDGKKTGDATATAEKDSLWKEGEMRKLREELWEAQRLWREMREKTIRGALATKITQEPAVDEKKKKKKLVRVILPDTAIKFITENPCMMTELSKGQMKKCPKEYRKSYAMIKVINAKKRAYHQALIEQHRAFGFAYDEVEVTVDDENDEEVEVAVVKD